VRRIQLLFLLNGVSIAVFGPFTAVILEERGLSSEAIGLLIALTAVAFVASISIWGHLGDVVLGRVRTLQVAILGAALLLGGFMLPVPILLAATAYVGYAMFNGAVGPLSDALAVNALPDPGRQYGRVRAHASAGFTVAAVVLGIGYGRTGYWPVPVLFLVVAVSIAVVAARIPDVGRATLTAHRRGGAMREALLLQPAIRPLLGAVTLAYIGVFAGFTFLSLRIVALGGGAPEVALSSAVAAAAEIGSMVVAGRLVERIGLRAVFAGSSVLYVVSLALWAVLASPEAIIASRVISGAGYSGMWIASVMAMRTLLPPRFQGSGQALISMTSAGVAAFLANALGGFVYGLAGAEALFAACALLSALAALAAWWTFPSRGAAPTTAAAAA
jgi:MFS transporter, PPP family, 3-phenylpropionic acid transporter